MEVTIGENDPIPSEQSITLAEIDNGYQLQLVNFAIAGITVEKIEGPVSITETGAVSGSATDVTVFLTVTANVTISGTIIDNAANLTINVSAPLTPGGELTEMIVKFNGTKQ